MKKLDSKSCEEIMTTVYKPIEFVVEGLIARGLYILAGAPKVGKLWPALDICLSIAKGEKVIGHETLCSTALYLCLEDSFEEYKIVFTKLQIEKFKSEHIVFIDTLQMVRNGNESSYGSDYKELSVLKSLSDRLEIAIVLVHHTRKCSNKDSFNTISGSTGISGCVDGSMVLIEKVLIHQNDDKSIDVRLEFNGDFDGTVIG